MIEEILTNHLRADETLAARLARYGGAPAVFCQKAPDDVDPGWEQGRQFPRAVFLLDMAGDPQREREGTLAVDIFCLSPDAPEDLEPLVRERLNGRFLLDRGGGALCRLAGLQLFYRGGREGGRGDRAF